jgi:hypothetical protein
MDTTARKISDTVVEITKTYPAHEEKHEYDLKFLLSQKEAIQKSKDDFCALRDQELKEIDHLIGLCEALDIKSEVIENSILDIMDNNLQPIRK